MKKIHILGIAGTFMAGIARVACELGFCVSGADNNIYPPMSEELSALGVTIFALNDLTQLDEKHDLYIIGNIMRRGMPVIEAILDRKLAFLSGPEFLAQYCLKRQHVLAVAGTHGKTTTSSMLAWILKANGYNPGYLIGGLPYNMQHNACLGSGSYFVVEADEYDTAFFDKRSKFVHYAPDTLLINNIEFDHADIFDNIDAIKKQFHHVIRVVPPSGSIIYNADDLNVKDVLDLGYWSNLVSFGIANGEYKLADFKRFGSLNLKGEYNYLNALAASLAALTVGISFEDSVKALSQFRGVARRAELIVSASTISLYSDFAHHPTAISVTLKAMKELHSHNKIISICHLASNSMRDGVHTDTLITALKMADEVYFYHDKPLSDHFTDFLYQQEAKIYSDIEQLTATIASHALRNTTIVVFSNGNIKILLNSLSNKINHIAAII